MSHEKIPRTPPDEQTRHLVQQSLQNVKLEQYYPTPDELASRSNKKVNPKAGGMNQNFAF